MPLPDRYIVPFWISCLVHRMCLLCPVVLTHTVVLYLPCSVLCLVLSCPVMLCSAQFCSVLPAHSNPLESIAGVYLTLRDGNWCQCEAETIYRSDGLSPARGEALLLQPAPAPNRSLSPRGHFVSHRALSSADETCCLLLRALLPGGYLPECTAAILRHVCISEPFAFEVSLLLNLLVSSR